MAENFQEYYGNSAIPSRDFSESFESLHRLSRTWHALHEDLVDLEETIHFLRDICNTLIRATADSSALKTTESIAYLASRTQTWRRWVANWSVRTKIRIDLFFNLASQNDNRTNLEIASTSKDIAEKTRNDSSSMITIAALTMLFLPGTFVSVRVPPPPADFILWMLGLYCPQYCTC